MRRFFFLFLRLPKRTFRKWLFCYIEDNVFFKKQANGRILFDKILPFAFQRVIRTSQLKCIRLTHLKECVTLNIQGNFSNVIRVQFQATKIPNINTQRGNDFAV